MTVEDVIALGIACGAGVYLVQRLTGWPFRRKPKGPAVILGARLARGLKKRS